MDEIMSGEATPSQTAGFLVALRAKGETADEIAGCAEAMRAHVVPVTPERDDLVDTAGTGGDGARTLNISTAAALVAAAAGAAVAKHGNRAVSSASGSADVLEALGFELELEPDRIAQSIDELGFGFIFAPAHHPGFRHAAPVRRELGVRTVFNVLGPLTNPAGARAQIVGVYSAELAPVIAEVLQRLGTRRAFVVHGAGGIDELSPAGPNLVYEVANGLVRERTIDPLELGVARCAPADLRGGAPEENAAAIRQGARRRGGRSPRRGPPQRRRRDRRRRARRRPRRRARDRGGGRRLRRRRRAARSASSRSRAPRWPADGTSPRRARRRRPGGDRRDQAPFAVGRRAPARRRSRRLAASFEREGAAAVSVLVDERFGGSVDDLRAARAATGLPLLAKGFFSTEDELVELRAAGADAVLLLLRDLDDETARRLQARARDLGMDALVEAHDADELARAVVLGADPIGVNARDLATFTVDRHAQLELVARAPRDRTIVAESGVATRVHGIEAELAGADAILVGSALMRAADPGAALASLLARPVVKVCGLTRQEDVDAAVAAGADLCGFVLVPESPRAADVGPRRGRLRAVRRRARRGGERPRRRPRPALRARGGPSARPRRRAAARRRSCRDGDRPAVGRTRCHAPRSRARRSRGG